ncbi:MAG TPA: glycosyltransferase family 2 protein [Candidatus Kapabacteria bacterium]|jgi:glycosyltransferase involved in cell wall biosynthesis|nr:glycosyltransferase family 2 protein [Candidatus Kapabacteria bacterium]HOV92406.1 glycosyltransferase family 2 protein [Candidatus Kapabacteria bacterium]
MNDLSISAAIIAKNAEDTISDTIQSILPYCNQIIMVDTGSDDSTPIIASSLGAEVYFYLWNDDFSEARNFSLKFARKEWILIIDSDEILDEESFKSNLYLLNDSNIGGINVIIKNYLNDDREQYSTHRYTRIFRNNPEIIFTGRIHEQIRESIENMGLKIIESDIYINHYGYNEEDQSKKMRNLEILKQETNKSINDYYLKYHLASTQFSLGNYSEAKSSFQEIVNSKLLSIEQNEMTQIRLAQINLSENNLEIAEHWLDFQSTDENIEGFRLFILAGIKLSQKDFDTAKLLYSNDKVLKSSYVDKKIIEEVNKLFSLM